VIAVAEIEQRFWDPGLARCSGPMEFGRYYTDFHWDPGSSEDLLSMRFMMHSTDFILAQYHELHIVRPCFIVSTQQKCGELAVGCMVFSDCVLDLSQVQGRDIHCLELASARLQYADTIICIVW
jgi:hypothetical protein